MKQITYLAICLLYTLHAEAQYSGGGEAYPDLITHQQSLKEFRDMRFGMFIHWGPVALMGEEISWSRGKEIPKETYDNLYKEFNPELFDAAQWVGAARDAGMKYLIITSRHHDGFSLWDSQYSEYDMAATPYGKGILQALASECEKQGIAFGFYYSICDWYHPDYPVEYPDPEYTFNEEKVISASEKKRMDRYVGFMQNQLEELISNFDPFVIWFDGEWEWAWTHEMGMDMYAYLRGLKDNILINNRVDKGRAGMNDESRNPAFAGDFATPEQTIGGFDNKFAWETCMTIGNQWAWKPDEKLKSTKECIYTLAQTIGGDGNLLFNVGPMPDGQIEQQQLDRLKEIGEWVSINHEAVYGTRGGPYLPSPWMVSTHKDNKIFLFLLEKPGWHLKLPLEEGVRIKQAYYLVDGKQVAFKSSGGEFILTLTGSMPDDIATVIVMELDRPASEIH